MENKEKGRHGVEKPRAGKKNGNKRHKGLIALVIVLAILLVGGWIVYDKTLGAIDRIDEDKIEFVDPEDQDKFDEVDPDGGSGTGTGTGTGTGDGSGNEGSGNSGGSTGGDQNTISWPKIPKIESDDVIKILLLGVDVWSDGSRGRSDVIMLATIHEKTGELSLTSFQRDTYVQIPGYKDNRINTAYAFGGTKLLKTVLELNFGITVDGVVAIDFTHFEQLIDALGGVKITLTEKEANHLNGQGASLVAGENMLNGKWALAYSRIRKIDSDFGRTNRQRTVLNALFQAYKDMPISEIPSMLGKVLPMVSTDLSDAKMISYATKVLKAGASSLNSNSIPCKGAYKNQTIRKMQVLVPDLEKCHEALKCYIYGKPYNP